jgi:hypothetical protein
MERLFPADWPMTFSPTELISPLLPTARIGAIIERDAMRLANPENLSITQASNFGHGFRVLRGGRCNGALKNGLSGD